MGGPRGGVNVMLPNAMTLRLPSLLAFTALSLLVLEGCGPKKRGKTPDDDDSAASKSSNDKFDQQVALAREHAPKAAKGSAVVLRFFNPTNNFRASMLFVDNEFPEKKESGRFLVLAEAKGASDELLATISLLHRTWQPGQYQCDDDTQVAFGLADHWDPQAPDTYTSWQPGAHCTLLLQEGRAPGDLEGTLRGEFVNNAGSHKLTIADGYLYIKQFQ